MYKIHFHSLLLVLALITATQPVLAQDASSWSDRLSYLEAADGAQERLELSHSENHLTNLKASQNKQLSSLQKNLTRKWDASLTTQSSTLSDGSILSLVDTGLGKATILSIVSGTQTRPLLSNLDLKKNNSIAFLSYSVSPSEKYVIVHAEEGGSIDAFHLYVVELKSGKLISQDIVGHGGGDVTITWMGENQFMYLPLNDKSQWTFDIETLANQKIDPITYFGTYPKNLKCTGPDVVAVDQTDKTNPVLTPLQGVKCARWKNYFWLKNNDLIFFGSGQDSNIIKWSAAAQTLATIGSTKGIIKKLNHIGNYFFVQTFWGPDQSLLLIDMDGKILREIKLPSYLSIKNMTSKVAGQSVQISVETSVLSGNNFVYDYVADQWDRPFSEKELLTKNNIQYVSEIRMITSRDGTVLPTRLVYRQDTPPSHDTPALIKVYGGFDQVGNFYSKADSDIRDFFIIKGGVLVTPMIRGGDEFGEAWHISAISTNKLTTMEDLIDIANDLTKNNLSQPAKIVITGTSNGGMVVASAGLLSPQSFGLVVPVSGVYDLLGAARLNPSSGGWVGDYGDPSKPEIKDYMMTYAPLELDLSKISCSFLFIAGLNDSRVNVIHSLKIMKKIRSTVADSSHFNSLFLKNAGHWIDSTQYEDLIAIREKAVIWSFIYQKLGWQ